VPQTVRTCRADCRRRAVFTLAFRWEGGKGFWYPCNPLRGEPPYYCLEHATERSMELNEGKEEAKV